MKWSFATVWVVILGLVGFMVLLLFQNLTRSNEQDYYELKEVASAAMIDSVDIAYYRRTGEIKIIEQKFVENFTRRFAETSSYNSNGYTLEFYDIIEVPAKISVRIIDSTNTYVIKGDPVSFNIVNQLDAILETRY